MQKDRSTYILEEIEKRQAAPIPRWHFTAKRFIFWLLASISVVAGSLAIATAIYVFLDHDFIEDHDYLHRFFVERPIIADIISSIPYIWLVALALLTLLAFFGFRHTKKGYRYSTLKVIGASLGTSLLLSLALNTIDIGGYIHRYLIENVHIYNKLINANEQRWTNSQKGLLGGKIMRIDKTNNTLIVRGFNQHVWIVLTENATIQPKTKIAVGKYLKIIGVKIDKKTFQALSIQPWEKKLHKSKLHKTIPSKQTQIAPQKTENK